MSATTMTMKTVPLVSTETSKVFCRAFCDFGLNFKVNDKDGEVTRETPLYRVEVKTTGKDGDGKREGATTNLVLRCMKGEKHEVSKGDIIEFQ